MRLDKFHAYRTLAPADNKTVRGDEPSGSTDPWADFDGDQGRRDNWMLSYIDILTLILTLFVLLLVLQPKYEASVSGQVPDFAELPSSTPAEPPVVEAAEEDAIEAKSITALIGPPFREDVSVRLAAPEISDEVVGGIEPAFYGGKKGILASATSESHVQPKELFVSRSVQGTADPLTRATVAPVQKSNEHARHPSTTDTDRPQASTTETVLAELKNLRFLSQLKVARIAAGLQLEVSDNILFAEGSAQLKLEGQKLLGDLAQVLLKHQGMISVEGHTDSRPISSTQFPSNWELSSSRASNVTRYLISHGLDPTKLRAVGYSDTRPVGTNATNEGRARNRRVSLVLEPVKDQ